MILINCLSNSITKLKISNLMKIKNSYFTNKIILITGGTGSIGNALIDYFISKKIKAKKIIIFSRDEWKQYEMKNKYSSNHNQDLRFYLGDIRDKERLVRAMHNVDIVIHAAALKQVDKAELDPIEAIKTNINGAQNIIEAGLDTSVSNVVALSTDKACSPINLYGATKLCSDKLFVSANNIKGAKKIKFSVVRYGNVLNSRGSVLPLFKKQINDSYFTITDTKMTRFLISQFQSVELIMKSLSNNIGGEVFIPKLPSFKIVDLARSLKNQAKFKIIGIRPGEKLHEELISRDDSTKTIETKDTFILVDSFIEKNFPKNFFSKSFKGKKNNNSFVYNSLENKNFLNIAAIKKIVNKLNLI